MLSAHSESKTSVPGHDSHFQAFSSAQFKYDARLKATSHSRRASDTGEKEADKKTKNPIRIRGSRAQKRRTSSNYYNEGF